jgi:hypothetical protein
MILPRHYSLALWAVRSPPPPATIRLQDSVYQYVTHRLIVTMLHNIGSWGLLTRRKFECFSHFEIEPINPIRGDKPSSEANGTRASQEIPRILWNPTVHCRVHRSPPLVPIMSKMNPLHNLLPYLFKIHFNIILTSVSNSPKRSISNKFSHQASLCISFLSSVCRIYIYIYKLWKYFLWSLLSGTSFFLPLSSKYYLNALFSNTLNVCSCLNVRNQVSHPHTTREQAKGIWESESIEGIWSSQGWNAEGF